MIAAVRPKLRRGLSSARGRPGLTSSARAWWVRHAVPSRGPTGQGKATRLVVAVLAQFRVQLTPPQQGAQPGRYRGSAHRPHRAPGGGSSQAARDIYS